MHQSILFLVLLTLTIFISSFSYFLLKHEDLYPLRPVLTLAYFKAKIGSDKQIISFPAENNDQIRASAGDFRRFYENSLWPYNVETIQSSASKALKPTFVTLLLALFYIYLKGFNITKKQHLRGTKLIRSFQLKRRIIFHNLLRLANRQPTLAKIPYPKGAEMQHSFITGGSGTGKTQTMLDLLAQIRKRGDRAIIYDRTGSFLSHFYDSKNDLLLNALDERGVNFNPFQEIGSKSDTVAVANILIPDVKGSDPYWNNAARIVFVSVVEKLRSFDELTIPKLLEKLLYCTTDDLISFLENTPAMSVLDKAADKTSGSIRSVLATQSERLELLLNKQDQPSFSLRNWIRQDQQSNFIFLTSRSDHHDLLKPLMTIALELAIIELLAKPSSRKNQKIWFFLDELPSLNHLRVLPTALAQARQFGGCFVISMQLISQLKQIYGYDGAVTISGLCRNRVFFSTPDLETAEWSAKNLGKYEKLIPKEAISFGAHEMRDGVSLSSQREENFLVAPSQIMQLPSLNAYLRFSEGFPATLTKIKPYLGQEVNQQFIANQLLPLMTKPMTNGQEKSKRKEKAVNFDNHLFYNYDDQQDIEDFT